MRITVTGATGFIGRHALDRLKEEPVTLTATGRNRNRWCGVGDFVELDHAVSTPDDFSKLGSPEVLLHLAWEGLPNYRSLRHFEMELPRQYNFLKNMVEAGLRRLIVVGTCFEYGMQSGVLAEDMPTRPATAYGFAKDALRRQLQFLIADSNIEFTWARLFYLWGEGQYTGSLYPLIAAAANRGDKSFNMSGGEQIRDYLPATSVADYLAKIVMRDEPVGLINICSGTPVSVRQLVEGWIEQNNWNIQLNLGHYPYPDYEPMAFWGDASKLRKLLT